MLQSDMRLIPEHITPVSFGSSVTAFFMMIFLFIICTGAAAHANELATTSENRQDSDSLVLEAISTADRSDGLGYVVRFHFTAKPDSFKIIQPSARQAQLIIYHQDISYDEVRITESAVFESFEIHSIRDGIGVDITLLPPEESANDNLYLARAYPDANGQHLLVGYTEITEREMLVVTEDLEPLDWQQYQTSSTDELTSGTVTEDPAPPGNFPQINRSATRFTTIVLDAGHGGRDPGAISPNGRYEKDVVLAVTKKVGEYIEEYLPELEVVYTRDDDTFIGLAERGRIANREAGNLFISIHTNSYAGRTASGAEFYFLGTGRSESALEVMQRENSVIQFEEGNNATTELTEEQLRVYELQNIGNMAMSQQFAEFLAYQFSERARRRSRGVKQAGLQVLFEASMPGVLVELGFLSNAQEERFMISDYGQSILASAIFRAVREYKALFERQNTENKVVE